MRFHSATHAPSARQLGSPDSALRLDLQRASLFWVSERSVPALHFDGQEGILGLAHAYAFKKVLHTGRWLHLYASVRLRVIHHQNL